MKLKLNPSLIPAVVFVGVLLAAGPVHAQITGIISPSFGTNVFDDVSSLNAFSQPGANYVSAANPWSGATLSMTQTDPTTLDYANGNISASGAGNSYSLTFSGVTLTQQSGNTGYADFIYIFLVDYQLGAGGLPTLPTWSPSFLVSGTVQSAAGSYASITGSINYSGVNLSGVGGTWDTVNYNWTDNTPGNFSNIPVSGTPVVGTMPALSGGTVFSMEGYLDFRVDPASLSVESVPEPGSGVLVGLAGLCGLCWRRFRR